ncbi:MAG: glycosyltransferase involved in cell wall biosynthesis [Bacteriovoracaceae bacterium]|jgi:glycosyltransferase involved in cell wall biosynthesis
MKIAILLPVRNGAHLIEKALDSVVNQTFFKKGNDYIIYLVDNDSSDDLVEKIKKYKNINYIKSKHLGIGAALNAGMFRIQSNDDIEYIARIDQDDEWHLNKLEVQMDFLVKNPDVDICGTQMHFTKGSEDAVLAFEYSHWPTDDRTIKDFLLRGMNPLGHPSIVYKKYIFNFCGGYDDATYKYAEDLDLWLKCLSFCKFANINQHLVEYRYQKRDSQHLQDRAVSLLNVRTQSLYSYMS